MCDYELYTDINKLTDYIYNRSYNHYLINKISLEVLEFLKKEFKGKKINQYKKINSLLEKFETEEIIISYYKEDNKYKSRNTYLRIWCNGEDRTLSFVENFEEGQYIYQSSKPNKEEIYNDLKHKYKLIKELENISKKFESLKLSSYYCHRDFFNRNYKGEVLKIS